MALRGLVFRGFWVKVCLDFGVGVLVFGFLCKVGIIYDGFFRVSS